MRWHFPRPFPATLIIFFLLFISRHGFALGQEQYIEEKSSHGSFPIFQEGHAAVIYVDINDYPGIVRVANDLKTDILRVSGASSTIVDDVKDAGKYVIVVGTIGKSAAIDQLVDERKIDVGGLNGKWESFLIQVVPKPWPGILSALIIAGSDKRGTIYGAYDLSEEMGVSPWHFWEDVPPKHHAELFVKAGKYLQGPPPVKYRGIFINDEAPDLTGWAKEKFGGYNHAFYTNVFELLLRLKANYLWPAMWNNCFNEDDPLNPKLADEYGIVMGTSHVEPMMRADKEWGRAGYPESQWNFDKSPVILSNFWRAGIERNWPYENIITMAMRGKIDTAMSPTANIALLEKIMATQREIVADVYHTNAADVPQLWALYKEVQEYYEKGMRVPDDITLLWCDDNWGNIRRLPGAMDRGRRGGAGIYYHLDYVGSPRNYKWINSTTIPKIWEQMHLAHEYGADQIWIVNVGHLQHVPLPTEFFLAYGWDPDRWPKEKLGDFTQLWAEREFGSEYTKQIAEVASRYARFAERRKPELLSPDTFSLINYQEADRVLADWRALEHTAEDLSKKLPADKCAAFFEAVLYPVQALANLNELYITAAKNRLYAAQGRASANDYAAQVRKLFATDVDLSLYYNNVLAGGKWLHMMDQTHIGYTGWQQPATNNLPEVVEINVPEPAQMGVAIEGSTEAWPGTAEPLVLPPIDKFNWPRRYVDVFNRGKAAFSFSVKVSAPWVLLSETNGTIGQDKRVWVSIDWDKLPAGMTNGTIEIDAGNGHFVVVQVPVFNLAKKSPKGFIEADGYVSIEAEHFTRKTKTSEAHWDKIDGLGRTLSGMTIFPVTAASVLPPHASRCLEYKVYLHNSGKVEVESMLSPSLNFVAGRGLRFALSFDNQAPQIVTAVPEDYSVGSGDANRDWGKVVSDSVRTVKTALALDAPGEHTLKFWMVDPGVVLQKLVVDTGEVRPSYLGPPESFYGK